MVDERWKGNSTMNATVVKVVEVVKKGCYSSGIMNTTVVKLVKVVEERWEGNGTMNGGLF